MLMENSIDLNVASFKELAEIAKAYNIKSVGVKTDVLRRAVIKAVSDKATAQTPDPNADKPETETTEEKNTEEEPEEENTGTEEEKETKVPDAAKTKEAVPEPVDDVYQGKTVINVTNRIVQGKTYKDVTVATGETYTLSSEEFERDVAPRK